MSRRAPREVVLAAIDIGTNSVRLEIARALPDGSLESLHDARDPIRPGEGVFETGRIPAHAVDRLVTTLRRYAALCRRFKARVRVVATSAIREARNKDDILRRIEREAGLRVEVISGREEARLICVGVLQGTAATKHSLCIDIGGGSTEVVSAVGDRPTELYSTALGAVRLAQLFPNGNGGKRQLTLMRGYAREAIAKALPRDIRGAPRKAIGSSGSIRAVVAFAAADGTGTVPIRRLKKATEELVKMSDEDRRRMFGPNRADIIVPGAVILEAVARRLRLSSVASVGRGLRDGVLVEMQRRRNLVVPDGGLVEAALDFGRRCRFDEAHARQVAKLSLLLFDRLSNMHGLPASARPLLETAALLHDVGNLVGYAKHHRHTYYLITNADIPGLADRERGLVARVARYHRRSLPDRKHPDMRGLSANEARTVRRLAAILRIADALDRSHQQLVTRVVVKPTRSKIHLRLRGNGPLDLELWDLEREALPFRRVFGCGVTPSVATS